MPKQPKLYLETSLIGFYNDVKEQNRSKRKAVRTLFEQTRKGFFTAFVSPITIIEISNSPEPYRASDLALLQTSGIENLDIDEDEVDKLHKLYCKEVVTPQRHEDDLMHIAYAVLSDVDILVSYNFKHINNLKVKKFIDSDNGFFLIAIENNKLFPHCN